MVSGDFTSSGLAVGNPGWPAIEPTGRPGAAACANIAILESATTARAAIRLACFIRTPLGTEILYCPKGGSANYQERYTPLLIHCVFSICCIMKSATSAREMRLPLGGRASPSIRQVPRAGELVSTGGITTVQS